MTAGRQLPVPFAMCCVLSLVPAFTGCAQQPQAEKPPSPTVAVVVENPSADLTSTGRQDVKSPLPQTAPAFEYPADLGGHTVMQAVAPDTPALPPIRRFGEAPRSRTVPVHVLNPEPAAKPKYVPAPLVPARSVGVRLAPPVERVPPDLGRGAGSVPAKPTVPIAKVVTERARDVNLPPPLPTLGRSAAERVSLDDPTSELANAAIAEPVAKVPLAPAAFLKVGIPDPFEFGDQVKAKISSSAEPGLIPVPINPRRMK